MKKHEPTYVIASTEINIGQEISRYSTWADNDNAKQVLRAMIANLAIQFANDHSLDGINHFIDHFYFALPPEPPTDYVQEAEDDAVMLVNDYFMDEIIDKLIESKEASSDINNDYADGDGIFYEVITDRSYSLEEAAELLSQLYRHVEEDRGLWEGEDDLDRIAEIKAVYTYGNAVQDEFHTLIMEINSLDIDDLKLETAVQCLKGTPSGLEDWEIIEAAEERCLEYSEQLKTRLLKEIKSLCGVD